MTCLPILRQIAVVHLVAAMLPAHVPLWFNGAVLVMIGVPSAGGYSCVAHLFASPRAQRGYRRVRRPLDALCGVALVGLGAKLVAERRKNRKPIEIIRCAKSARPRGSSPRSTSTG